MVKLILFLTLNALHDYSINSITNMKLVKSAQDVLNLNTMPSCKDIDCPSQSWCHIGTKGQAVSAHRPIKGRTKNFVSFYLHYQLVS